MGSLNLETKQLRIQVTEHIKTKTENQENKKQINFLVRESPAAHLSVNILGKQGTFVPVYKKERRSVSDRGSIGAKTGLLGANTGSNRAQNTANVLNDLSCVCLLCFFSGGELIIPKWLINDSGHISKLVGSFLELQKFDQISTPPPGPLFITKMLQ